ncbi:MAG: rhomboid family intramembrane serine protease [Hyphomicrobiales bacterium]|nr:MAG: rhomboid family intramembrane serine protease [Hyphomicrobiales bacterium]
MNNENQFGKEWQQGEKPPVPPMLNVPPIMTAFIVLLISIHGIRVLLLSAEMNFRSILAFSFIPARYAENGGGLPYPMAEWWSPVTYALLHADWGHVLMNSIWMLVFGAIVARRIGAGFFILFAIITALGGAALHYVFHAGEMVTVIGASAIVSGFMGAAARFAFARAGYGTDMTKVPMLSLAETFTNRQVVTFLALWFGMNFLFGSGIINFGGEAPNVAWQAHVGGFLTGLFGFSFFDRHPNRHR